MTEQISRRSFIGLAGLGAVGCALVGGALQAPAPVLATDTHEVTDSKGNVFELPNGIETAIITMSPYVSMYVLYHGGTAEGLVGMSPGALSSIKDSLLVKIAPEILDVDTSYYLDGQINVEQLLTLHPDVAFISFESITDDNKTKTLLDQAGLNYYGFSMNGPADKLYVDWLRGYEQVYEEPGKMDDVIAWSTELIDLVRERTSQLADDERKRVMIMVNKGDGSPLIAGGDKGTSGLGGDLFGHNWLKTINAVNVADDVLGIDHVNLEQIYTWEPDIVFMTGQGQCSATVEQMLANEIEGCDFEPLAAVREGRVYSSKLGMWSWLTANSDVPLVALWLASTVYPELFEDVSLDEKTREYYKLAYGYDLTDEELESIYADSHRA